MHKIKNKILIIGTLTLISININAGWAKHRDRFLKGIKNWVNSNEQRYNNRNRTNTNNAVSNTNTRINNNLNNSFQIEVVRLVNIERRKRGLAPLSISNRLSEAAAIRANEIVQKFSHTRPDGSSYHTVIKNVGYMHPYVGENIAAGRKSPEEVMNAWMNSNGHRASILNPNYTEMGVGFTYVTNSMYGTYWVQIFGSSNWGR